MIISRLARQKLRYDLGAGFMSMATFATALISASDKIGGTIGISPRLTIVLGFPLAVAAVWFVGYLLDRFGFAHAYQDELNNRNEKLMNVFQKQQ